jgi:hypothetical protein
MLGVLNRLTLGEYELQQALLSDDSTPAARCLTSQQAATADDTEDWSTSVRGHHLDCLEEKR